MFSSLNQIYGHYVYFKAIYLYLQKKLNFSEKNFDLQT